ncbi:MAG: apolipoprotein N-acyltransferase [Clostridia bacterium]|nr:apolipoprotein N-acyltransferase [Clostridia bacterium]
MENKSSVLRRFLPFSFGTVAALPIAFSKIGIFEWVAFLPFAFLALTDNAAEEKNPKKRFFSEYLTALGFFFGFYTVLYSWFWEMYPLSVTGMPRIAAFFVICLASLGIPLFQAIGFSLVFPIFKSIIRKGVSKPLLPLIMGALWAVCEWMQGFFWFGIPWVRVAMSQTNIPALVHSSNLFGSYFVTFLILSVNFYIALAIKDKTYRKKQVYVFTAALIFLMNGFYGMLDIAVSKDKERETVRISALQGNISTEEKWNDDMLSETFRIYEELTKEASGKGSEYVLFPETAIPYVSENVPNVDEYLRRLAKENDVTLMVGTFVFLNGEVSNGIRIYEPGKEGVNVYYKQKPVPFGEYVPMRDIVMAVLPALGEINMLDRTIVPGKVSSIWNSGNACFGHLICFDSIYDYIARNSIINGAEVLMISTNDSWFGASIGTRMHCMQASLRAVENGRSVVRAANTGISAVINPEGKIENRLECGVSGILTTDVVLSNSLTLYTRVGNLFIYICIIFTIICLLYNKNGTKCRPLVLNDERTVF